MSSSHALRDATPIELRVWARGNESQLEAIVRNCNEMRTHPSFVGKDLSSDEHVRHLYMLIESLATELLRIGDEKGDG